MLIIENLESMEEHNKTNTDHALIPQRTPFKNLGCAALAGTQLVGVSPHKLKGGGWDS